MQNNNMNKIVGVLAVAVLALVVSPKVASANGYYLLQSFDAPAVMTCNPQNPQIHSISPNTAGVGSNGKVVTIKGACFTVNSVARFNGQNRFTSFISTTELRMETTNADMSVAGQQLINVLDLNNGLSNTVVFTVTGPVATNTTANAPVATTGVSKVATVASVTTKPVTASNEKGSVAGTSDSNSNLSANAVSSGASFIPDTLLEWVFLFILILLGVKLWRSATVTEKEKNAPLKHA